MLSFTAYVTLAMMVPMQVSISSSLIARLVMTSSLGRLLATSISRGGLRENRTATPLILHIVCLPAADVADPLDPFSPVPMNDRGRDDEFFLIACPTAVIGWSGWSVRTLQPSVAGQDR